MNDLLFPYLFSVIIAFAVFIFLALRIKKGEAHEESRPKKSKGKVQLVRVEENRVAELEAELFATKSYEVEKRKQLIKELDELN